MTDPDRAIWAGIVAHLRTHHPNICRQWFADLLPLGVHAHTLGVRAASDLHRDYLRRECVEPFNDAARTVTGQLLSVRFLGPDEPWAPVAPARDRQKPAPPREHRASERVRLGRGDALPINPDYDFASFVVGPSNQLAARAASGICKEPGVYNPLFIHAGVGLGKTHLLQAICLEMNRLYPSKRLQFISCDAFLTRFMDAVNNARMSEFRDDFRETDVLLIDDIHFLASRERTQEEFFHTFNALKQAGKQIVLSSDAPPNEIPDLEQRLVSRFEWGLVAQIDRPDIETRVEILKRKAALRGVELPEDAAWHVAERCRDHIRQLEGAISTLVNYAAVKNAPIDLALAREAVRGEAPARATAGPSIETIIAAVTDYYRVKKTDVLGKRRHKSISLPRQVCMYLARAHTRCSLEEIGAQFGGRDHTTVIHAVRAVESRRGDDPAFAQVVISLEEQLRASTPGRD